MSLPTMWHVTLKKFENFSNVLMLISPVGLTKYLPVYLETADTSAVPLSMPFNLSFKQGCLPKLWKSANITPIHKEGDLELVENYRGISLLSIMGKCQERIVYNAIYNQVISFVHDSHHGFLTGHSCTTQQLLVHHDWFKVWDKSGQVDVVFTDFSNAFDLVCHDILLAKLYKHGVHGICSIGVDII